MRIAPGWVGIPVERDKDPLLWSVVDVCVLHPSDRVDHSAASAVGKYERLKALRQRFGREMLKEKNRLDALNHMQQARLDPLPTPPPSSRQSPRADRQGNVVTRGGSQ